MPRKNHPSDSDKESKLYQDKQESAEFNNSSSSVSTEATASRRGAFHTFFQNGQS